MKNPKKNIFPEKISPQLATLSKKVPEGKKWIHEIKLDGYRLIAFKNNNKVYLRNRKNKDWTELFKQIHDEIMKIDDNIILDGEIVVLDEVGKPDFQLLQNSLKASTEKFIYYIFDLLFYENTNLMKLPLIKRKNLLKKILPKSSVLRYSEHIVGNGKIILKESCDLKLEGIISKDATAPYLEKRTISWLKIKCLHRQEFLVVGFTQPKGSRKYFGSLLLGMYDEDKNLVYCGKVGTGFSEKTLEELHSDLVKNKISSLSFKNKLPNFEMTFVKPKIIVEIEFLEWTKDNILRQSRFKGIRKDKVSKEIKKEESIYLTHPDKILYPEKKITKKSVMDYYMAVQDWILPYIVNRPLTLLRCSQTYKDCFFQRHVTTSTPGMLHSTDEKYIYIKDREGLLSLPQINVLEIHPWGSTIDSIDCPDRIVFDLDPAFDMIWSKVVDAAFYLKTILEELKLMSFVKSTGGKGLHIVVPIKPEYEWREIKNFAHAISQYMVSENPKRFVNVMTKSKRSKKIFVDYLRNQRSATAIAPYSTRANKNATVAVPLSWDELSKHHQDSLFTIISLPKRLLSLKKDPWEKLFTLKQKLPTFS